MLKKHEKTYLSQYYFHVIRSQKKPEEKQQKWFWIKNIFFGYEHIRKILHN
jgi:hypothetical protein